jgi:hypothetical protein
MGKIERYNRRIRQTVRGEGLTTSSKYQKLVDGNCEGKLTALMSTFNSCFNIFYSILMFYK